jgi:DNA-binding XRE family transcriptional regulator
MLGDQVNDPTEIAMPNGLTEAAGVEITRPARPQLQMPNIATVFKAEITRLARKEVRENSDGLRKALATQRTEIASFKRRIQELEGLVKKLAKGRGISSVRPAAPVLSGSGEPSGTGLRFRAKGMAANRKRLGLSAADFGLLVGATGQSVYAWESGKAKPRAESLAAIAALRGIGKLEAEARLDAVRAS